MLLSSLLQPINPTLHLCQYTTDAKTQYTVRTFPQYWSESSLQLTRSDQIPGEYTEEARVAGYNEVSIVAVG